MYLLSFSSTLWLSLSLVFFVFVCVFYLACFFCFVLFLCCRGQRFRALGKKKRGEETGERRILRQRSDILVPRPLAPFVKWSAEGKRVTLETALVQSTKTVFLPTCTYSSLWNESRGIYSNKTSPDVRQRLEQST